MQALSSNELLAVSNWTNGIVVRPVRSGTVRLFCFPPAGGGASLFRLWTPELSPEIEVYPVQLPGRESRWQEPALTHVSPLAECLSEALRPVLQPPYVFFGHSMGGFIGFELARQIRRENRPGPALLIVSATRAPQIPDPDPPIRFEPPGKLLGVLRRLEGIPNELLDHPELVALLLPTLRADLAVCENFAYRDEPPLDCPIAAYGGQRDEKVPLDHLSSWRVQTHAEFQLRVFPGKHFFFLKEARVDVTQALCEDIGRFARGQGGRVDGPVFQTRGAIERAISDVWREVLRVSDVGLDDNFFDLGGNSLLMVQAHFKLRATMSTSLSVLDLFRYPTVRLLAHAMRPAQPGRGGVAALGPFDKERPS